MADSHGQHPPQLSWNADGGISMLEVRDVRKISRGGALKYQHRTRYIPFRPWHRIIYGLRTPSPGRLRRQASRDCALDDIEYSQDLITFAIFDVKPVSIKCALVSNVSPCTVHRLAQPRSGKLASGVTNKICSMWFQRRLEKNSDQHPHKMRENIYRNMERHSDLDIIAVVVAQSLSLYHPNIEWCRTSPARRMLGA